MLCHLPGLNSNPILDPVIRMGYHRFTLIEPFYNLGRQTIALANRYIAFLGFAVFHYKK